MSEMQRARLIPTSGIGNDLEAEMRATSALLAVMTVVRDFSISALAPMGAPRARKAVVEAFTEVNHKLDSGQKVRPDGLIRVTYGSTKWSCLVEVKTGNGKLESEQLNNYLAAAKELGAQYVLSISNELGIAGAHPTSGLKVRANSVVQVAHLSWTEILTAAVQCKEHRGVEDPEQAWILGELIRYLQHPASGASAMEDMGPNWVTVRDAARENEIKKTSEEVAEIAAKWDELVNHIALRLTAETGVTVTQQLPKAQRDPKARIQKLTSELAEHGELQGVLRVPNAASDIEVAADLRARRVVVASTIPAPQDKKGRGSVSWLTRQIDKTATAGLEVEAFARNARNGIKASIGEAAEDSSVLLADGQQDVAKFVLSQRSEMGQARKTGTKTVGFIDSVVRSVDSFYATVLQNITPWTPPAPQVKKPAQIDRAAPGQSAATQPMREPEGEDRTVPASQGASSDSPVSHPASSPGLP